jgi:ribonuclease HI
MYKLFTDGGSRGNPGKAACAAFIFEDNKILTSHSKYLGIATNNFAEYSGLLLGLELALKNNIFEIECFLDSELVVKQVKGIYKVKHPEIVKMMEKYRDVAKSFKKIGITHVPRAENKDADELVNEVLDEN